MDISVVSEVVALAKRRNGSGERSLFRVVNSGTGSKYFIDADSSCPFAYEPLFRTTTAFLDKVKTSWKQEERQKLVKNVQSKLKRQAVNLMIKNDDNIPNQIDWKDVSMEFDGKSPMECCMQFRNVDDPTINKDKWKREEEYKLLDLIQKHDAHDWVTIAAELKTNRTPIACLRHYQVAFIC